MSTGTPDRYFARPSVFRILAARGRVRRELKQLGIKRSPTSDAPVWILVSLLTVAAGAATIGAVTRSLTAEAAVALAAVVLTVAGLLVAVLQWRAGLAEKAFDALYQRIGLANQMRLSAFQDLVDEEEVAEKHPELYRFFVYSEIDSLEYAARRYRFGLGLNADIVDRAVRHFRGRCASSKTFSVTAARCARDGAYFEDTKDMVESILNEVSLKLGAQRLRLTIGEARELESHLVLHGLQAGRLDSDLARALSADLGQREVDVTEEMRQELLPCLDAIEADRLSQGLTELRKAARTPIA